MWASQSNEKHAGDSAHIQTRLLRWPYAAGYTVLAVASFHLAYQYPPLAFLMCVFAFCIYSLAWVRTTRWAFYLGLTIGLATYGPQLAFFWGIFGPAAIGLWMVAAFWLGMFLWLSRATIGLLPRPWAMLSLPLVWTGLEYFRSELYYLRFSWLNPGFAFSHVGLFQRVGVYGIGFVLMLAIAVILLLPLKSRLAALILGLAGVAVLTNRPLVQGSAAAEAEAGPFIVGIQLESINRREIMRLLDEAIGKYPQLDVVVLSEYQFKDDVTFDVRQWCRRHKRYLIAGGVEREGRDSETFRNTAFVIGPAGQALFKQGKSVPIQFFSDGLPATEQDVWESPWGKIGLAICYDLSYSRVIDRLIKLGADALIIPTMDVESWGEHEHILHSRVAPVRAAEYGIPIVRACSSGISQIVLPNGRVIASAPYPGQGEMIAARLPIRPHSAHLPPDRYLALGCVAFVALLMLALMIREITPRRPAPPKDPCLPPGPVPPAA